MSIGRVMIVEDDDELRQMMLAWLATEDVQVMTAANGAQALRLLESAPRPDLILTDLMMPVANGWSLCAGLANDARLAGIPVVVLSAVTTPQPSLEVTPVAVLAKPLDLDALSQIVHEVVAGVQARTTTP
jgi:CheY-like chemotaxis protein